jgi:hypothetical protein
MPTPTLLLLFLSKKITRQDAMHVCTGFTVSDGGHTFVSLILTRSPCLFILQHRHYARGQGEGRNSRHRDGQRLLTRLQ